LPVAIVSYSFIGITKTSASTVAFSEPIWNPVALLGRFHQPWITFLVLIGLVIATMNVNIAANVVSPSNDLSNLAPRLLSFRTSGLITGFLVLAMMPWKLMATFGSYLFGWLVVYSGLLGLVAELMVTDYFSIRGTELNSYSLYRRGGICEYRNGLNPATMVAWLWVCLPRLWVSSW
jgi:NCS1 family nucleobase:cation symporter-1